MKQHNNYRYNTAIAEIADWQYTTYVRTHYNIKPHTADMMEEKILQIEANIELIKTLLLGSKKILTLDEACQYTGYTKSYMYKLTSGQKIPHLKRGKKVFFDKDELDAWMRQNKILDIQTQARNLI